MFIYIYISIFYIYIYIYIYVYMDICIYIYILPTDQLQRMAAHGIASCALARDCICKAWSMYGTAYPPTVYQLAPQGTTGE